MIKDFDSQPDITQNDNPPPVEALVSSPGTTMKIATAEALAASRAFASHLKLVASADPQASLKPSASKAVSEPVYKSAPSSRHYFTAEVRKRSPYDFIMAAQDPFHYLHCELPLSFEENQEGMKRTFSLVCEFPEIGDDALVDFIDRDEDLLGMILISFQMQILNNLFLFCAARKAQKLIIKVTEDQFKGLGIYEEFIEHVDKIPTKKGMAVEITIPVHSKSLEQCDELISNVTMQFRQTLWRDQASNSVIRDYLKSNTRFSVVT